MKEKKIRLIKCRRKLLDLAQYSVEYKIYQIEV